MKMGAEFEVRPPAHPRQAQNVERPPRVVRPDWGDVAVREIPMSLDCDAAALTEHEVDLESDATTDEVGKRVDDSFFTKFRIDGFQQPFGGYTIGQQVEEVAERSSSRAVFGVWRKSREGTKQGKGMKASHDPPLVVIRSSAGETQLVPPDETSVKVIDTFQMQAQRVATRSLHFRLTRSWH
jgi:hypothetical protein